MLSLEVRALWHKIFSILLSKLEVISSFFLFSVPTLFYCVCFFPLFPHSGFFSVVSLFHSHTTLSHTFCCMSKTLTAHSLFSLLWHIIWIFCVLSFCVFSHTCILSLFIPPNLLNVCMVILYVRLWPLYVVCVCSTCIFEHMHMYAIMFVYICLCLCTFPFLLLFFSPSFSLSLLSFPLHQ